MRKDKSNFGLTVGVIFLSMLVGVIVVVLILLNTSSSYTSEEELVDDNQDVLVCSKGASVDDYFYIEDASNVRQTIKIFLSNDMISKISYEYNGDFISPERAKEAMLREGIDYDLDIQASGVSNKPSSSFTNIQALGKIELYGTDETVNSITGKLFFIDEGKTESFKKSDITALEKYYKGKNFRCKKQ